MRGQTSNFRIGYTSAPPPDRFLRVEVPSGPGGTSDRTTLKQESFWAQHGKAALPKRQAGGAEAVAPDIETCVREVADARGLIPTPTLASHGFEVVRLGRSARFDAGQANDDPWLPDPAATFSLIQTAVQRAVGADDVHLFMHARRSALADVRNSLSGAGYASFFHTDYASQSWPALLPTLIEQPEWLGPPGVPHAFAKKAQAARRRAVVTAWVYLGPETTCRGSHLVLCDSSSLDPSRFGLCRLECGTATGLNYRLFASLDREQLYYFSSAATDEAVCFVAYDSDREQNLWSRRLPLVTVMHGAGDEERAGDEPTAPARESVDARMLLLWN